MDFFLHLEDPASRSLVPVRVTAPEGRPGAVLVPRLEQITGRRSWYAGSEPLAVCRVGSPPLVPQAVLREAPEATEPQGPALVCTEGPDSGRVLPLHRGRLMVGKDATDLRVEDDALPPWAGTVDVGPQEVIWRPDGGEPRELSPCEPLLLGRSRLELRPAASERIREPWAATGHSPLPHPLDPWPVRLEHQGSGWIALLVSVLVPVLAGTMMAWAFRAWSMLALSLVGAAGAMAHWLARGSGSARNRRRLAEAAAHELETTDQRFPPAGRLLASGVPSLSAPAPVLRWGRGRRPAHLSLSGRDGATAPECQDAPLLTCLEAVHVIPHDLAAPIRNSLVIQLLASGRPLCLVGSGPLPGATSRGTDWARRWSSHPRVRFVDGPARHDEQEIQWFLDPASARALPRPVPGASVLLEAESVPGRASEPGLPDWAMDDAVVVRHSAHPGGLELTATGPADHQVGLSSSQTVLCAYPDAVGEDVAAAWLRQQVLSGGARHAAEASPLLSGRTELAVEDLRARWARHQSAVSLQADFGDEVGSGRPVRVDLNAEGPHCIVAGTTGAGKSELLQGMLLALALEYSPARLSMVLIDFKGAASFGEAADLPHVGSLLTDLDEHSIYRDLAFLEHEVRRREIVLGECRQASWADLVRQDPEAVLRLGLPELLVCVDEFRLLVESYPEAMKQLLKIATVGRSLGLHLLLSTQRPQGAVSSDIRANVALNVCLRVASEADSVNVLGSPEASRIPTEHPGEGFVRSGSGLRRFRSLFADSAPCRAAVDRVSVELVRTENRSSAAPRKKELRDLADRIRQAAQQLPSPPVVIPPALADAGADTRPSASEAAAPVTIPPNALALGPAEVPDHGWQGPLAWSPTAHGLLEVLGSDTEHRSWLQAVAQQCRAREIPVLVLCSSARFLASALAEVPDGLLRVAAISSSAEFFLEAVQEITRCARKAHAADRAFVVLQGPERMLEDLMKLGAAGEAVLDDLFSAAGDSHWVCVLGRRRLPSALRHHVGSTLWAGAAARAEFDLLRPRAARAVVSDAWLVEGSLLPWPDAVGGLVVDSGSLCGTEHAEDSRPGLVRARRPSVWQPLSDLPRSWTVDPAAPVPAQPAPIDHRAAPESLVVGIGLGAPDGRDVFLDLAAQGVLCISGPAGSGKSSFVEVLRPGNDPPEVLPEGSGPGCILVLEDLGQWSPVSAQRASDLAEGFDAVVVTVDSAKSFAVKDPWISRIRRHPATIVLGPRSGAEPRLWLRSAPPTRSEVPRGHGVVLEPSGMRRFCFPHLVPAGLQADEEEAGPDLRRLRAAGRRAASAGPGC